MMFDSPPWLEPPPELPPVKMGIAMPIIPTPKIDVVDGVSQALLYPIIEIACVLFDVENMLTNCLKFRLLKIYFLV